MRPTLTLFRREFTAYFLSPIAYVVLAVFLLVTGHLFYLTMNLLTAEGPTGIEYPMQMLLGSDRFWLVFLFIPPLLTMRLFAEERGTGTLEMLLTAPIRDWQVVFAKYAACLAFYVVLWLPTLVFVPVFYGYRGYDWSAQAGWTWTTSTMMFVYAAGLSLYLAAVLALPLGPAVKCILTAIVVAVLAFALRAVAGGTMGASALHAAYTTLATAVGFALLFGIVWLLMLPGPTNMASCIDRVLGLLLIVHLAGAGWWMIDSLDTGALGLKLPLSEVLTTYAGILLAGSMFLALGLLISSLVKSQMVAALIALVASLVFLAAAFWPPESDPASLQYRLLYFVSVPMHFHRDFTRGLIDSRHLILYASVAMLCLFLTVRSLESRRWR